MLDIEIAIYTPETNAPGNNPAINLGPKTIPIKNGVSSTNRPKILSKNLTNFKLIVYYIPGLTISFNEA